MIQKVSFCVVLIVHFIFFTSLDGMIKSQDQKEFLSSSMQVVHCLIHKVDLDHNILCSLAVNKTSEQWLRETALGRKIYLKQHIDPLFLQNTPVRWHKYGSACGRKIIDSEYEPRLKLQVYYMQQAISLKENSWEISQKN